MDSHAGSLPDGEDVVVRLRPHAGLLVGPLLVLLASSAVAGFLAAWMPQRWQPTGRWVVAGVAAVVVVRFAVVPWLRWLTTCLVVTDRRVTLQHGVLRRTSRGVPLSRVADVGYERTFLERLIGSGTLVLDSVGERGGLVVRHVPDVRRVADTVTALLDHAEPDDR